jgi:DivIVA domain-containing protein
VPHDPHTIRNTSFSLAVNGFNPEQVDQLLVDIAVAVEQDRAIDRALLDLTSVEVVPAGYDIDEVAAFVATFTDDATDDPRAEEDDEPVHAIAALDEVPEADEAPADADDDPAALPDEEPHLHEVAQEVEPAESEPGEAAGPAEPEAASPAVTFTDVPGFGDVAQGTLHHAVERTKQTVVELEVFLNQQFELAKAACQEAVTHTQDDCSQTMKTARNVTQAALSMTEDAAERLRAETSDAIARMTQDMERQLAFTQRTFQQNLLQCQEQVAAEIERLVGSARSRASEISVDIDAVQAQVEDALADARSVLTQERRAA